MKIILIGNYLSDKQESMIRFANMLQEGFKKKGIECEIWYPIGFFGKIFPIKKLQKWIDYLDKWVLYPIVLKIKILKEKLKNPEIKIHICDHSNAPYLHSLPKEKTSITCHDVLAIRGAFGFKDAYCPASGFGKILQKWILHNLSKMKKIAFVSELTRRQYTELLNAPFDDQQHKVIHNSFNAPFFVMDKKETKIKLSGLGVGDSPYLLNVGSNLERKNRRLLVDMLKNLKGIWDGKICFAGDSIDVELVEYANQLDFGENISFFERPNHENLVALYSGCEAFILPSFSEGFGWTLIEAQACGAPVIASDIEPMPEVSGDSALHADPYDAKAFADSFLVLLEPNKREEIINKGFENIKRFDNTTMIDSYIDLILQD